jgi:mRNA interferase HigB
MELQNESAIKDFMKQHQNSREPLRRWKEIVKLADWKNIADVKRTFPSADYVRPYVVFNIAGNRFRLVAVVAFTTGIMTVDKIMTHETYNRWKP